MEEQVLGQIFGDYANRDGECDSKEASICFTLVSMEFELQYLRTILIFDILYLQIRGPL